MEVGHTHAGGCADVGRVGDVIHLAFVAIGGAVDLARQHHHGSFVAREVHQLAIDAEHVAQQVGVEHRAVLAVAIGVVEHLVEEERLFVAELLVVGGIFKRLLHKIEYGVDGGERAHASHLALYLRHHAAAGGV